MVAKSPFDGLKVLVTRPQQQAKNLCELIEKAGGKAISFPVIEIENINNEPYLNIDLTNLDIIIFVSRNAVSAFVDANKQIIPEQVQLISVGAGSAESMREHGLRVDLQPEQSIGSEGLLLMPRFANMVGQKVLIIRGLGGRELLADTLKQRGATVQYLEVYQRLLPSPSELECEQAMQADVLVCTSVEGIKNLVLLLQKGLKIIYDKPMLVVSERIKKVAVSLGFKQVFVTESASDIAVIEQLTQMEVG